MAPKIKRTKTPPRISESPLARLKRRNVLNVWELTAADEIQHAHRMSIGEPASRDPDLGIPNTPRADAADNMAARRVDVLDKYNRWRADLQGTAARVAVTETLIHETALRATERAYSWRNGSATMHLLAGLRHFAALRGNTPNGARGWKVQPTTEAKGGTA